MNNAAIKFLGPPCGHQGSCNLYKSFRYVRKGKKRKLSLGQYFFVQILENYPVAIGELQLLWEDKSASPLCSLRAYFLPEHTQDGRQCFHGDDEVLAVSDKIVLRLEDLVSMIRDGVSWGIGSVPFCDKSHTKNGLVSDRTTHDVSVKRQQPRGSSTIEPSTNVHVLSYASYCRYRAVMKRLEGSVHTWIHDAVLQALGGLSVNVEDSRILFCRDDFDFPELDNLDIRCDHLLPVPRGKSHKKKSRSSQDSGDSNDDANSDSSYQPPARAKVDIKPVAKTEVKADTKTDAANSHQKSSVGHDDDESDPKRVSLRHGLVRNKSGKTRADEAKFLASWKSFMKSRNTPVDRIPSLGFKQIDVYFFYMYGQKLGGYAEITKKRLWKHLYDRLGGDPRNTSAATCTRRHYERLLLPYECYVRGERVPKKKGKRSPSMSADTDTVNSSNMEKSKTDIEVQRILDNIHTSAKQPPKPALDDTLNSDGNSKDYKPIVKTIKSIMEKIAVANKEKQKTPSNGNAKSKRKAIRESQRAALRIAQTHNSTISSMVNQDSINQHKIRHPSQPDAASLISLTSNSIKTPTMSPVIAANHRATNPGFGAIAGDVPLSSAQRVSVIQQAPSHPSQLHTLYRHPSHAHNKTPTQPIKTLPAHQLKRANPGYIEQNSYGPPKTLPYQPHDPLDATSQFYHDLKRRRMSSELPNYYLSQMKNLADIQRNSTGVSLPVATNNSTYRPTASSDCEPKDLSMRRTTPLSNPDENVGLDLSLPKKPEKQIPFTSQHSVCNSTKPSANDRSEMKVSPGLFDLSLTIPPAHSTKLNSVSQPKVSNSIVIGATIAAAANTSGLASPNGVMPMYPSMLSPSNFLHPAFPLNYLPSTPLPPPPPILPQTLSPMDIQKLYESQLMQSSANQMAAYRDMLKNGFYTPLMMPYMQTPLPASFYPSPYPSTSTQQPTT